VALAVELGLIQVDAAVGSDFSRVANERWAIQISDENSRRGSNSLIEEVSTTLKELGVTVEHRHHEVVAQDNIMQPTAAAMADGVRPLMLDAEKPSTYLKHPVRPSGPLSFRRRLLQGLVQRGGLGGVMSIPSTEWRSAKGQGVETEYLEEKLKQAGLSLKLFIEREPMPSAEMMGSRPPLAMA
jgi:hypothetical protein